MNRQFSIANFIKFNFHTEIFGIIIVIVFSNIFNEVPYIFHVYNIL